MKKKITLPDEDLINSAKSGDRKALVIVHTVRYSEEYKGVGLDICIPIQETFNKLFDSPSQADN